MGRHVLVIAVAVLGGITAAVLMLYIIGLTGHAHVLLGFCAASRPQVCSRPNLWEWLIPCAGVVGAIVAGAGTSMELRHWSRSLDSSSSALVPTRSR
jgi:hypothetical protein